jgi:hypothetical protein
MFSEVGIKMAKIERKRERKAKRRKSKASNQQV